MCKIFTLSNMSKVKELDKTINTIARALQHYEKDGFGYTIVGKDGVYGERTTLSKFTTSFKRIVLDVPFATSSYNRFGTKSKPIGAGIFHGRTSTNDRTLLNTHPINKHGWSLIHNGVVSNHGPEYSMLTTNDTEHVLEYLATGGIDAVAANLTGYYAISALDPNNQLHVFRDAIAPLYTAFIKSIDSYVFATKSELISTVCKELKWSHSTIEQVYDNSYLVLNKNEIIEYREFTSRGRTAVETKYASKSLGYELSDDTVPFSYQDYLAQKSNVVDLSSKSPLSDFKDEKQFLHEVNVYADSTYTFIDYRHNTMDFATFQLLDDEEKLYCTVVRSDGTIVCPDNYDEEKLYERMG